MKNAINATVDKNPWARPKIQPNGTAQNRNSDDIALWNELVDAVRTIGKMNDWSKAEVARRIGMPDGTFSQWYAGSYAGQLGKQNAKVQQWVEVLKETAGFLEKIPEKPAFQRNRIASEIIDTLTLAQSTGDMVMITLDAGSGKTETCRHYRSTRPHVYLVTASPHTRSVHGILNDMAAELEVVEYNPTRLTRAIGKKLERVGGGTLLIVDEAQNLTDEAINQLRHFVDINGTGLALVGNDEISGRLVHRQNGPSYAQIKSRLAMHLKRRKPYSEDIAARIHDWGIEDVGAIKFLTGIGLKAGALRQIDKTMMLARMAALGDGCEVTLKHVKAAWKNRDVEELA
ncbi:AAA family ATPase [Bartonella sp. TS25HLJMH]|uniref:AAA family ATPase n=2 Tax=unclassified Bartonella TaxID=2645622 RepID=UPI0035D0757D